MTSPHELLLRYVVMRTSSKTGAGTMIIKGVGTFHFSSLSLFPPALSDLYYSLVSGMERLRALFACRSPTMLIGQSGATYYGS